MKRGKKDLRRRISDLNAEIERVHGRVSPRIISFDVNYPARIESDGEVRD